MAMQGSRTHQDGATMKAIHPVYIPPAPYGPVWIAVSLILWTVLGINACGVTHQKRDVSLHDPFPDCSDTSDNLQDL
jgi:hypothetical protein